LLPPLAGRIYRDTPQQNAFPLGPGRGPMQEEVRMKKSFQARTGLVLLVGVASCAEVRRAPTREFAGVHLERAAELPEAGVAWAGAQADFGHACAMRLRDPRDSSEMLLVRSRISTPTRSEAGRTITQLESATGEYALLTADGRRREPGRHVQVDCITGRATGWVAPGA
jgi:hypothetical protein